MTHSAKNQWPGALNLKPTILCLSLAVMPLLTQAQIARPQIVFAVANSQSMDGTLSGAIMTGSGMYNSQARFSSLSSSASPLEYQVPAGFTPPLKAASASRMAPYTVNQGGVFYDNGASRLNVAKAGMNTVLDRYLGSVDFALATYKTGDAQLYSTWAYYMSGRPAASGNPTDAGRLTFVTTQPVGRRVVNNPCYAVPGTTLSASLTMDCNGLNQLYPAASGSNLLTGRYMVIESSADDANINDVMYIPDTNGIWDVSARSLFVSFDIMSATQGTGGERPSEGALGPRSPYELFTLDDYNRSQISISYGEVRPWMGFALTYSPTNAGFLPFAGQVMHVRRGFGFGSLTQDSTDATVVKPMTELGGSPTTAAIAAELGRFGTLLQPETNNPATKELKAVASQAATAGLIRGAGGELNRLTASCAGQYVILVTDGLPTMSLDGQAWPPLGSAAGNGYGVYATFAGIAPNPAAGIKDGRSSSLPRGTLLASSLGETNDRAVIDAIAEIKALHDKGIKTYVIGLGAGVDSTVNPAANAVLNAMAIAGGTQQQYPASDIPSFQSALDAIVGQINTSAQIMAPAAASSVNIGSLVYLSSTESRVGIIGGHVQAYKTRTGSDAVLGVADTKVPLWDAGSPGKMSAKTRKDTILTTGAKPATGPIGSGDLKPLAAMGNPLDPANYDPAAFGWPLAIPSSCVPGISTILAYTFNPSYNSPGDTSSAGLQAPTGVPGCSYLAGRKLNWMLGSLSPNNTTQFIERPGVSASPSQPAGYKDFATVNATSKPLLMLNSNDGILYGVDVDTGEMKWGWMPRPLVSQLHRYTDFQSKQQFDGGFKVVDAVSKSSGATGDDWASYVVGTAQGGGYHYSLKLKKHASTDLPTPVSQAWGIEVPGGTSAKSQAPLIVTLGASKFAVFVVTTKESGKTVSRLYEVNVATGKASVESASLSGELKFVANSQLSVDGSTLWVGDASGGIWSVNLSGAAAEDVKGATKLGTVAPAEPINFVGYGSAGYVWASTKTQLSVLKTSGEFVWSSRGGENPENKTAKRDEAPSSEGETDKAPELPEHGEISGSPLLVEPLESHSPSGILVVPVHVPSAVNSCGPGSGYYYFFEFATGGLPGNTVYYNHDNSPKEEVSGGVVSVGIGAPFTPTEHFSPEGKTLLPGTNSPVSDTTLGSFTFKPGSKMDRKRGKLILWRRL